jgi:hypothetical protein
MDPITAALNLTSAILAFAGKVWDATPQPLQAQAAADWASFTHNLASFLISLEGKVVAK